MSSDNEDTHPQETAGETMHHAIRDWVASGYEPDPCIVTRFHVIAECDDGETRWLEYGGYSADGAQLAEWEATGLMHHALDVLQANSITERIITAAETMHDDEEGDE